MEKLFDLTDFIVDASDTAESFAIFKKYFADEREAFEFKEELMGYIYKQVETGKAKYCLCDSFTAPRSYFPMVLFKHVVCLDYNEYGEYEAEDEDEEDVEIVEVYDCVKDVSMYHAGEGALLKITLLLTYLTPQKIDKIYKSKEVKIITYGD